MPAITPAVVRKQIASGATAPLYMLVGAGTALKVEDVARVRDAGGRIIVSPDTKADVIAATAEAGLVSSPGYFTPSEAFAAIRAGATAL